MDNDETALVHMKELLRDLHAELGEDNKKGLSHVELNRLLKTIEYCANEDKDNQLQERQVAVELTAELMKKIRDLEEKVKEKKQESGNSNYMEPTSSS